MTNDDGWARVGPAMKARMREQHVSKNKLVREGHVDWATVDKLLAGIPVREQALWRVADYLGWRGDAFDRIRRGDAPVEANRSEPSTRSDLQELLGAGGQIVQERLDDLDRRLRVVEGAQSASAKSAKKTVTALNPKQRSKKARPSYTVPIAGVADVDRTSGDQTEPTDFD